MSSQPSLISVAEDTHVQRPSSYSQWQLFRDTAAAGLGEYYAMNKDGVKESLCCGDVSGLLLHVRATLNETDVLALGTTPFLILSLGNPDAIVIVQTTFLLQGSVPYTVAANNQMGLYIDLAGTFPQAYSDILESDPPRHNLYNPINGQAPPATTSQVGSGDLYVGMFDTTTGAQSAVNPTGGNGDVVIDVWYVIRAR